MMLTALVSFHRPLLPGRVAALTGADMYICRGMERNLHPSGRAVIQLRRAKTRRRTLHAVRQFVAVEDAGLSAVLVAVQYSEWWQGDLGAAGMICMLQVWPAAVANCRERVHSSRLARRVGNRADASAVRSGAELLDCGHRAARWPVVQRLAERVPSLLVQAEFFVQAESDE